MKQRRKVQDNTQVSDKKGFLKHLIMTNQKVDFKNEIMGGLTSFLLLSYFFVVSSKILVQALSLQSEFALSIYTFMVLLSAVFTFFACIFTKLPVIYGISTGLTVFFTASAFEKLSINGSLGFGLFIVEGLLFLLLLATPFIKWLLNTMPKYIQIASPAILGSMIIFYAITTVGIIPFNSDSIFIAATIKTPSVFLFVFVLLLSIVLYFAKVRYSFLMSLLIGLFTGLILSKTNVSSNLRLNWIILSSVGMGWLFLFSILYDKKVKKSLDVSLWFTILAMFIICIFFNNELSIIVKPSSLYGKSGIFYAPSFSAIPSLFGNSITSLGSLVSNTNTFLIPLFSLLVFHILTYILTLFTVQSFGVKINGKKNAKNLYLSEGLSSITSGLSCVNPLQSFLGTSINLSVNSRTFISSVFYSLFCIVGLYIYPFVSKTLSLYIIAPLLASIGIILIYKGIQKLNLVCVWEVLPFAAVIFICSITQDITLAFTLSIVLYAFLSSYHKKKVTTSLWFFCIFLFLFEFVKISIPFLSFP